MAASKLGARIRSFREKKDLSRADLADKTGLEADFIAALEDEDHCPSLGPLIKIARALGVRLGTFLDDAESADPLIVRLAEREQALAVHTGEARPAACYYSLGRGKADRHMEPFFIELFPDAGERTLSAHQGEEFIVVVSGRLVVVHGRDTHHLGPGDSIYMNSIVPHYVGAEGDEPAAIHAVLYFPQ